MDLHLNLWKTFLVWALEKFFSSILYKPSVFSLGFQETPLIHHPHWQHRSHHNPEQKVWEKSRLTVSRLTPQYFSPLNIWGGRACLCPSFFLALALITSLWSSMPGAVQDKVSTWHDVTWRDMTSTVYLRCPPGPFGCRETWGSWWFCVDCWWSEESLVSTYYLSCV